MNAQTTGWMARIRTACVAWCGSGDRRARDPGARAAALGLDLRERDSDILLKAMVSRKGAAAGEAQRSEQDAAERDRTQ